MQFYETSAKTNINIHDLFQDLTEKILEKNIITKNNYGRKLNNPNPKNKQ